MPKFGTQFVLRFHPLHDGQAASSRFSEESPRYYWREPSCTIYSSLETNGFSQVALRFRIMDFLRFYPECRRMNVSITQYDGVVERFCQEVKGRESDTFLDRPLRLAARDGSFAGQVRIDIEPQFPVGSQERKQDHCYTSICRYSSSPVYDSPLANRIRGLWECKTGHRDPLYNKTWVPYHAMPSSSSRLEVIRPASASGSSRGMSYETPRIRESQEAFVNQSVNERLQKSTPVPRRQEEPSWSPPGASRGPAKSQSSSTSGHTRQSSVNSTAGAADLSFSSPVSSTTQHRPASPTTYSSNVESSRPASSTRPSGEDLARAIEARRMQIEELKREEEEAKLLEEFEAQEKEYQALLDRKVHRAAAKSPRAASVFSAANARLAAPRKEDSSQLSGLAASTHQQLQLQPPQDPRLARRLASSTALSQSPSRQSETQHQNGSLQAVSGAVDPAGVALPGHSCSNGHVADKDGRSSGSSPLSVGQTQRPQLPHSQAPSAQPKRGLAAIEEAIVSAKKRRIEQDNEADDRSYTMTRPIKTSQSPPPYTPSASTAQAVVGSSHVPNGREVKPTREPSHWEALFVKYS